MLYDPKIYIRGYGAPEHRLLAFWVGFVLEGKDAAFKRHLILHTEGTDTAEPYLLLSGDMTDGDDALLLSGVGNDLIVLTENSAFRLFGPDVTLIYSIKFPVDVAPFTLNGNVAAFYRDLVLHPDVGGFDLVGGEAALRRALVMHASSATFGLTGIDIGIDLGIIFGTEPGIFALGASDARLLRHYPVGAGAGTFTLSTPSVGLVAGRLLTAGAGTFTLTGKAADLNTDQFIALAGDMTDGDDLLLLSGDMQSGTDFLTISKEGL